MNIIEKLEKQIEQDCTPVDREAAFNDMLDECYSFESVGGPFACMSPSRVLLEVDPTAHRCGVNDYADGQEWVEVGGETYEQDKVEEVKQELVDELQEESCSEWTALAELQEVDDEDRDEDEINDTVRLIAQLDSDIKELESHSF